MEEKNTAVPDTVSEKTPAQGRKLSRRQWLDATLKFAIGAPFALKELEKALYNALIFGTTNPNINDQATLVALKVSEKAENSENPGFRSMTDIVKEGISSYSEKTAKPVFFKRVADYKGTDHYADVIRDYSSSSLLPQLPGKLVDRIPSSMPKGAFESFFQSQYSITSFEEIFTDGSGFEKRFRSRHSDLIGRSGLYINNDQFKEAIVQDAKSEISELKRKVEEKTKETGQQVSASYVLALFLEKNEGDLSSSIFDTAIFLKFMARNNLNTGDYSPGEENVQWYKQNIKDEYQGPSYSNPPHGESVINLIGKPYHSWNLVSLLQFVPVEVVRLGGLQKQLSTFKEQGLGKTRADLQTLTNLREVEQLLLSYSTEGQR